MAHVPRLVVVLTLMVLTGLALRWSARHPQGIHHDEANYINYSYRDAQFFARGGPVRLVKALLFEDAQRPPAFRVAVLPFTLTVGPSVGLLRGVALSAMWVFAAFLFAALTHGAPASSRPVRRLPGGALPAWRAAAATLAALSSSVVLASFTWYSTEFTLLVAIAMLLYGIVSRRWWVVALALALGGMSKLTFALVALAIVGAAFARERESRKPLAIACAVAAIPMLPWWGFHWRKAIEYGAYTSGYIRHSGDRMTNYVLFGFGSLLLVGFALSLLFRRPLDPRQKTIVIAALGVIALIFASVLPGVNSNPRYLAPAAIGVAIIGAVVTRHLAPLLICALLQLAWLTPPIVFERHEQWDWRPLRAIAPHARTIAFLGGGHQCNESAIRFPWIERGEDVRVVSLWRFEEGPLDWPKVLAGARAADVVVTMPGYGGDRRDRQHLDNRHNAELVKRLVSEGYAARDLGLRDPVRVLLPPR